MKKYIAICIALTVVILAIVFGYKAAKPPLTSDVLSITQPTQNTTARICYSYHHTATTEAPYTVDEFIDLSITDTNVLGIKQGTQSGPDMSNGYSGTIVGTYDDNTIKGVFTYTIEGSQNSEKEIYAVNPSGLEKLRYPLYNEKGTLVPDVTKPFSVIAYQKVDCSVGL